jgi:outer membrane lipoprotein-sorting protein
MKQARIHLIIGLLLPALSLASQNAADILDKASSAYRSSRGMVASFVIRTESNTGQTNESSEGIINMNGDKFTLATAGVKTWYDGKTQWVYMEEADEVNISTPEGDELQMINPAILLRDYRNGFTSIYKGEGAGANGNAVHHIELIPKKKADMVKIELQVEKVSNFPVRIQVEMKNGIRNTIQVSRVRTGINQPDSFFSFRKADYPNAEVIDLR